MASPAIQDTFGGDLENIAVQLMRAASDLKQLSATFSALPDRVLDVADTLEGLGLLLIQTGRQLPSIGLCDTAILQRSINIWKRQIKCIVRTTTSLEDLAINRTDGAKSSTTPDIEQLCNSLEKSLAQSESAYQLFQSSRTNIQSKQVTYTGLCISGQARVHAGDVYYSLLGGSATPLLTVNSRELAKTIGPRAAAATGTGAIGHISEESFIPDDSSFRTAFKQGLSSASKSQRYRARLKPWFLPWIWTVSFRRAATGWDVKFRTYNLVPHDAPIFQFLWRGDIGRVQKLIDLGAASPYDESDGEGTVAENAIGHSFSFVRRYDIDIEHSEDWYLLGRCLDHTSIDTEYEWCRFVVEELHVDAEVPNYAFSEVRNPNAARLLIRQILANGERYDAHTKLTNAWTSATEAKLPASMCLCMEIIGCAGIGEELASLATTNGRNLVHMVPYFMEAKEDWSALVSFVRQLNKAGASFTQLAILDWTECADYQRACKVQHTAYLATPMMRWIFADCGTLECWAKLLKDAGVDLLRYGEEEAQCWQEDSDVGRREGNVEHWYSFEYGPAPTDWKLHTYSWIEIDVYERVLPATPPGSWPVEESPYIPTVICWDPHDVEELEGEWKFVKSTPLAPSFPRGNLQSASPDRKAGELQDDHGLLYLRLLEGSRLNKHRLRRSISQPEFRAVHLHGTVQRTIHPTNYLYVHRCVLGPRPRTMPSKPIECLHTMNHDCIQNYDDTSYIDKAIDRTRNHLREEANMRKLESDVDEEYARRFPNG